MAIEMKSKVNISCLKVFAQDKLPPSPLRDLILSEDSEVGHEEFLIKLGVWLRLLTNATVCMYKVYGAVTPPAEVA